MGWRTQNWGGQYDAVQTVDLAPICGASEPLRCRHGKSPAWLSSGPYTSTTSRRPGDYRGPRQGRTERRVNLLPHGRRLVPKVGQEGFAIGVVIERAGRLDCSIGQGTRRHTRKGFVMPPKFPTLEAWSSATYGDAAPRLPTLRRWARERRILPRPVKHGRAYFVQLDAGYVDPRDAFRRPRLVDPVRV